MLLDRILAKTGRGLAAAGLALFGALLLAPSARADAAQVTVVSPGGAQQTLALEAMAGGEDVVARPYVLRSGSGETRVTVSGFSLAKILDAAGADPYSFSYVDVQRPAGGSVRLSRHQALDSDAFAEGPPAVYATPTGTGFVRPSSGPDDANAADSFEAPQGLTVNLRKGKMLSVKAKAAPQKTKPGKPVRFEAVLAGAGAGEEVEYSWYFDDGGSATAAKVTHRFAKRGSYDVVVGVTTPGNETGASAVVTVQVGDPGAGPDRKGGGTNEDAGAPDHGAAEGPGGSAGMVAPAPIYTPEAVPYTPAPAPEPVPQPAPAEEQLPPQPPPEPEGGTVSGQLLQTTGPAAAEDPQPSAAPVARTGKLSESGGGEGGLPGAAVGLLVTAGLLGLGGLVEARNLLR